MTTYFKHGLLSSGLLFAMLSLLGCAGISTRDDGDRYVSLQLVREDGRYVDDAIVTLRQDGVSMVVLFDPLHRAYKIPSDQFFDKTKSISIEGEALMYRGPALAMLRSAQNSSDSASPSQMQLYTSQSRKWFFMDRSEPGAYQALPDPYAILIIGDSIRGFDIELIKEELQRNDGIVILDVREIGICSYVIYMNRPLKKYNSETLARLRGRKDVKVVGCVAKPDDKIYASEVYYRNRLLLLPLGSIGSESEVGKILDQYQLKTVGFVGPYVHVEGPLKLGEGIVEIAEVLSELSSVKNVSVETVFVEPVVYR